MHGSAAVEQGGSRGALAEWRAHGLVLMPCLAGVTLVAAHGHSLGVMIRPLEEAFGWPRAQISAGFMFISIMGLLLGPAVGRAVDRFGPRRIGLVGVPIYCATLAMLSLAGPSILSWWVLWFVLALGSMLILPVVWIAILNPYFHKSRGLAMAVALSGTGVAAALFPMTVNALVEAFGWRMAYVIFAGCLGLVTYPLVLFLFREAGPRGRRQAGTASPASQAQESRNRTAALAETRSAAKRQMASARYIKLALASFIFAVASCVLTNNMVPVLLGEGLTPATAAATAGLLGIGSVAGRLLGGVLLDRYDANKVAAISVIMPIAPTVIFLATDQSQAWAAVACLIMGISVGAELDTTAYLTARHFGARTFGSLFGTINGLLIFGAGLAPLAANAVFDATKSYDIVLIALIPLCVITAVLLLALGSYRHLDPETGVPMSG